MRKSSLNISFLTLLAIGGCSQIIGLSDYEVDATLGSAGETSSEGGEADGQGGSPTAGTDNSPQAGDNSGVTPPSGGEGGALTGSAGNGPVIEGGNGNEGGMPPLGVLVPCTSFECCTQMGGHAVGTELLPDGGFEAGPVEDGNDNWTEQSTNNFEVITLTDVDGTALGFKSHTGDYYAYLSGLSEEVSSIYSPNFIVPVDAGWMTVSGYRLFQIDTQDATNEDFGAITLWDSDPKVMDPVEVPFFWGAPAGHADGWGDSPSWKKFERSWDATPHRGQQRYLGFSGSSDAYSMDPKLDSSAFLFDDVSLKIYRCYQ